MLLFFSLDGEKNSGEKNLLSVTYEREKSSKKSLKDNTGKDDIGPQARCLRSYLSLFRDQRFAD